MATIVDIRSPAFFRPAREPALRAEGSAEILLFTGVRYERRMTVNDLSAASPARRRDRLELED